MRATRILRANAIYAICAVGLFAVLSASAVQAVALTATLSGSKENPANASVNTGTTVINVDPSTGVLTWNTTTTIPIASATGHHIHEAPVGVNGTVRVGFAVPTPGYSGTATISTALAGQIAFNPGAFYVNLHTAAFPGGEIRGQLVADPVITPTLSTATLIALALALIAMGAMVFRRRNRV